ncbi:hypothetical protein CEXT_87451 [Caerostris extrusa]|uniref:Uncharacterized protein n=1 Tax=Caerostris extrusa TaxID=172846 RepID=A0AAV4Y1X5_CAEEX|nr:hypothetical protein CEXT_87451 [Caerostris extrusa]
MVPEALNNNTGEKGKYIFPGKRAPAFCCVKESGCFAAGAIPPPSVCKSSALGALFLGRGINEAPDPAIKDVTPNVVCRSQKLPQTNSPFCLNDSFPDNLFCGGIIQQHHSNKSRISGERLQLLLRGKN